MDLGRHRACRFLISIWGKKSYCTGFSGVKASFLGTKIPSLHCYREISSAGSGRERAKNVVCGQALFNAPFPSPSSVNAELGVPPPSPYGICKVTMSPFLMAQCGDPRRWEEHQFWLLLNWIERDKWSHPLLWNASWADYHVRASTGMGKTALEEAMACSGIASVFPSHMGRINPNPLLPTYTKEISCFFYKGGNSHMVLCMDPSFIPNIYLTLTASKK